MSSRTKKPVISAASAKEADELETTFDLYKDLADYERRVREENDRRKNRIAREIEQMGESYLSEIDEKFERKEKEKIQLVQDILKSSGKKYGDSDTLYRMPYEEVKSIYNKVLESKKSWYRKLFEFFMQ